MAHILSELSNDIYDPSDPTIDGMLDLTKGADGDAGIGPGTVFLGVFVALIPKVLYSIILLSHRYVR